jgi:hypothetical protein
MSRELEGKVGIVTGAATGKAIAFAFGAADAGSSSTISTHPTRRMRSSPQISRDGRSAALAADIGKREEFEMLVDGAIDRFGSWDVLVNNAAVALVKPFGDVTEDGLVPPASVRKRRALRARLHKTASRRPGSPEQTSQTISAEDTRRRADRRLRRADLVYLNCRLQTEAATR